eukprot:CAMPEP_0197443170 /NCGR_PEP_ID=MMETSP1175-20131217/8988_1 /TAXON_ID=1003142 /ORGANISM="Triceratium dubium, Strain CCMP147" /LENGTH=129 /DNA_ID=CAMNT_0042973767 /DNA_START=245 /DNA_END=634 /DNA_ORIENTATION=+
MPALRPTSVLVLLLAVSFAAAFQPAARSTPFLVSSSTKNAKISASLFLAKEDEKSEVDLETPSILPETDEKDEIKSVVKNINTGEEIGVKWSDPTLEQQSLKLDWWAWVGIGYVVLVYLNDFFHFFPKI